ncbi:sigma factor-like helix-turn-helix DNA-binding protein [Nonomuraea sp. NPDC001699]
MGVQEVAEHRAIADRLGLTRERVRQLEKQALKRLRQDGPLEVARIGAPEVPLGDRCPLLG